MRLITDTDTQKLIIEDGTAIQEMDLYSAEAFRLLSAQWLKVGWNQKYIYTFSWLGRPIIQLPEDMIRAQEAIYQLKPDVILETGVAHGGSLVYYASLCQLMGKGRVIGVDIEIRPHNRQAIDAHFLRHRIEMIEGDSTAEATVAQVKSRITPDETTIVFLDSNHSKAHVLEELQAYHSLVTPGSYIVAADGIMQVLFDVPRGNPDWRDNNPSAAAIEFARTHPEFAVIQPPWPFNESSLSENVTHWPSAWLQRTETP
ncbi:MAG: CmcI family methyltransferase [Caldilineaceae bacterium]